MPRIATKIQLDPQHTNVLDGIAAALYRAGRPASRVAAIRALIEAQRSRHILPSDPRVLDVHPEERSRFWRYGAQRGDPPPWATPSPPPAEVDPRPRPPLATEVDARDRPAPAPAPPPPPAPPATGLERVSSEIEHVLSIPDPPVLGQLGPVRDGLLRAPTRIALEQHIRRARRLIDELGDKGLRFVGLDLGLRLHGSRQQRRDALVALATRWWHADQDAPRGPVPPWIGRLAEWYASAAHAAQSSGVRRRLMRDLELGHLRQAELVAIANAIRGENRRDYPTKAATLDAIRWWLRLDDGGEE